MERIKANNLRKNYGNRCILNNASISFYSGEIIGLIGENGVGKTTFIKLLCGLIYPDEGEIFINGMNTKKHRTKCMENIGVLLDGSRSVYWRLSAWQNFIYFSGLKGIFGNNASRRAEKIFKLLDLWEIKNNKVETFSCGLRQRLAFACTISHEPSVVLLDEPTSGLDICSNLRLENYILLQAESENF